jgi:hypothetical protein
MEAGRWELQRKLENTRQCESIFHSCNFNDRIGDGSHKIETEDYKNLSDKTQARLILIDTAPAIDYNKDKRDMFPMGIQILVLDAVEVIAAMNSGENKSWIKETKKMVGPKITRKAKEVERYPPMVTIVSKSNLLEC